MFISTSDSIANHEITEYLGIVSGEAFIGSNILSELQNEVRDVIGSGQTEVHAAIQKAKDLAISEVKQNAKALGATGIISIDLDFQSIQLGSNTMLMVCANGTAVICI